MRLGGFQKLTLVDFPGLVAATVFVQGCNYACGYCHNRELVLPQYFQEPLSAEEVFSFLSGRRGKIEGVVITGGEPTLQKDLPEFMRQIKDMGFLLKLDTNGSHPEILRALIALNLIDYIALDIKSSLKKYAQVTCTACNTAKLQESIHLILNSPIPYQFRTTLVKEFCSTDDLDDIQALIASAKHYVLQPFVISEKIIDSRFSHQDQYTSQQVEVLKAKYERLL